MNSILAVLLQQTASLPQPPAQRTVLELQIIAGLSLLIILLIDLYAFQAIKTAFGKLKASRTIYTLYWLVTFITVVLMVAMALTPAPEVSRPFRWLVTGWVSMWVPAKLIVAFFLSIDDLIRLAKWVRSWFVPAPAGLGGEKISRSTFLMQAAVATGAVPVLATGWGIWRGAYAYRVEEVDIHLPNLPKSFNGLRILQLSDAHTGSFNNHDAVQKGIELAMAQKPDLIFFTGDLVNNIADEVADYLDLYKQLKAPMGIYSILGNHDYGTYAQWLPPAEREGLVHQVIAIHKQLGWDILLNEHRVLERNGETINLIGVENWGTGRFPRKGDMQKARANMPNNPINILLSHDPSHWDAQVRPEHPDVDLMLSGHTHGMQFGVEIPGFKWSPVQYRYKQWGGLYTEGNQHLYVNRGFGFIGFPGRVGMPPEITVLTLRSGKA